MDGWNRPALSAPTCCGTGRTGSNALQSNSASASCWPLIFQLFEMLMDVPVIYNKEEEIGLKDTDMPYLLFLIFGNAFTLYGASFSCQEHLFAF